CGALRDELETAHNDLHRRLNRDEQKLLLQITDLQSGIHRELAQEPPYSFDRDEERRAEAQYLKEQEE
ncbi:MAG: hypothetical protein RR450_09785, partial [Oscillospiraceae bacterium]